MKLYQGHIFWPNLKGFFSTHPKTHHLSWASSPSCLLWLEVPQPPEHPKFMTSDPLNIFLLFWTKSTKKRRPCLWLWRRYSRCQNVAGNREFGHSVWCHGSIFSLVAFGRPVARDVSKRNSCFTSQHHFLSYLKPHHMQHFVARCLLGQVLVSKHAFIFN